MIPHEIFQRKNIFMDTSIRIDFKVTPAQKQTIEARMFENGFDEIASYVKVVALKTQKFKLATQNSSNEEATIKIEFSVTQGQVEKLEENMQNSNCEDMSTYLQHVALHAVVYAVIEVRSTGNLDAMLARIANSRK